MGPRIASLFGRILFGARSYVRFVIEPRGPGRKRPKLSLENTREIQASSGQSVLIYNTFVEPEPLV
jgi:hypothetical protein